MVLEGGGQWSMGAPQTLACVVLLGAGCAKPSSAVVITVLLLLPGLRPCSPMVLCLPGPPLPRSHRGHGVLGAPPFLCPCCGLGLPCLPSSLPSNWSPGPLRFRHMSGEVTLAKTGMSLGASGPAPLSDQVASTGLRE